MVFNNYLNVILITHTHIYMFYMLKYKHFKNLQNLSIINNTYSCIWIYISCQINDGLNQQTVCSLHDLCFLDITKIFRVQNINVKR